jgi:aspartyl-tRNA(Asn)/glutamyl-tRNA(Gln) amidotransferase subunit C
MSITAEEIERIAKLAKLEFSQDEKEQFRQEFGKILTYIEKISEVDVEGVEPLASIEGLENVSRNDEMVPSLSAQEALSNAPRHNEVFIKVPKVLE